MGVREWPLISSDIKDKYRIFSIRNDRARSPRTGSIYDFVVLNTSPWVNIIPLTANNEVVLIRQYRHGTREVTLEIPGGLVEEGEPHDWAALRELEEETGYGAKREDLIYLGKISPNPAIQNNICHSYLARNACSLGAQQMDDKEDIELDVCPLKDIPALIQDGTISHSLVVVAFYRLLFEYLPHASE
jgi:ADP-ribose pyrophosphatase